MEKKRIAFTNTVYNVYFPGRDNPVLFHGPFYEVRKRFFEDKKASRKSGIAFVSGVENTYSAKIGALSADYELKYGDTYIQRLYREKGGYCVITRDYSNKILSKTSFDKKHKWKKTAYYDNGNTAKPQLIFSYEDGAVVMFKYDKAALSYFKYPLYFCSTVLGTKENSVLDSKFGQPIFYMATDEGDFAFYTDEESAELRKETLSILENTEISVTWDNTEIDTNLWSLPEEMDIGENYRYIGEQNEKGEREGRGRTEQLSGITAYEGEYLGGKRNGKGACFYEDGILSYYGSWADGKKNGVGVSVKKGFEGFHVGNWSAGKLLGTSATFDEKGTLKNIGYVNDKDYQSLKFEMLFDKFFIGKEIENGNTRGSVFDLDGTLVYSGEYKDGKYNGKGTLFAPNGAILMQGTFKDGICVEKKNM